jgi:hypothetical protein
MKYTRLLPMIGFAWLNAIGCIQVDEPDDDECDTDQDCASDRVCENGECVARGDGESGRGGSGGGSSMGGTGAGTASGGTGNAPTESGCLASWEAASKKCSLADTYRQPVLDDCERRRNNQPPACLDEFDAGLACEASESAWACGEGDTNQATLIGCAEQVATHRRCLDANAGEGTGGSGGSGGTGGGTSQSACDECLDTCSGLPSCCTGTGCICESSCRPSSDCTSPAVYCCGPDGFCFCTSNCPY